MEKRAFNKVLKQRLLENGFEKTGRACYAREAADGITKIVIRAPDYDFGSGIGIGAQFRDFLTDYADYSGKSSRISMAYHKPSSLLPFPARRDYTEGDIDDAVALMMEWITPFLVGGKNEIRSRIDEWTFGLLDEKKKNEMLSYMGLPVIDPYCDEYIIDKVKNFYDQRSFASMPLEEYEAHKDHYDRYALYGCKVEISGGRVYISLKW